MKFGVFDHMDRGTVPLGEQYENRLKLVEAYDRAGIRTYHLAEHHATPLGMAPSPSVFLAAVAQRTQRLRLGPLVYTLLLYHPLRLTEEICTLDQLSGGKARGRCGPWAFPRSRSATLRRDPPPRNRKRCTSRLFQVVMKALRGSRSVSFQGEHYRFDDVPIILEPVQKPHPPLWYGVFNAESTEMGGEHRSQHITTSPPKPCARSPTATGRTGRRGGKDSRSAFRSWE